ncbi:MAG TPA: hypothetical protein VEB21_13055, partial [Terriglobales bacterium]|nr:hypothetical protein [Terriglobales bacterium]
SGERFLACNWMDTIHAEAQAMWDLRRLIGWLRQHGAPSIGVYGLSLGGYTAALLAALERDLACAIAGMPAVDMLRLAKLHMPPATLAMAKQVGVTWTGVRQMLQVISPLALDPLVPRSARFIFGGSDDKLVPIDHVRALWNHWERPKAHWYEGSHLSFRWEPTIDQFIRDAVESTLCARSSGVTRQAA